MGQVKRMSKTKGECGTGGKKVSRGLYLWLVENRLLGRGRLIPTGFIVICAADSVHQHQERHDGK
jgi:hypothetical protein